MLIGYARVSTHEQDCALQTDALTAAGCDRVFLETASGAKRDRPELKAALAAMTEGDTLVVWRLDRLARSLRHLLETIEGLEGQGKKFRSLTECIDTSTSGGKLIFSIIGAIAEFERALISERTKAGLEAARLRGRRGGRPRKNA
jgi:DNA invertase Pin-like site-specific DNA recombinase